MKMPGELEYSLSLFSFARSGIIVCLTYYAETGSDCNRKNMDDDDEYLCTVVRYDVCVSECVF